MDYITILFMLLKIFLSDMSENELEILFKDTPQVIFQNDRNLGVYYRDTQQLVKNNLYQMSYYNKKCDSTISLQIVFFQEDLFGGDVQIENYSEEEIDKIINALIRIGFEQHVDETISGVSKTLLNTFENDILKINIVYKEWVNEQIKENSPIKNIIFFNIEKKEFKEYVSRLVILD